MKDRLLIIGTFTFFIILFALAAFLFVHSDGERYKDDPKIREKVEEVAKRFAEDAMHTDNIRCAHLRDNIYACMILNPPSPPVKILCNTELCEL